MKPSEPPTAPTAPIAARSATALVIASMIGVGVFTTSGFALHDLGSRGAVLLAWLAGGAIALCGALSYGALALRFPDSGGEYEYLRRTLHPTAGTAAGLVSMVAGFGAPLAAAAHLLQVYGCRCLAIGEPTQPWVGTVAIVLAAWLHGRRVELGTRLQDRVVAAKLALMALFLIASLRLFGRAPTHAAPPVASPWRGLVASMPWIYLAYSGWNASAYIAGEVVDARRNVPRAMVHGCLLVTALYLALNAVFLWSVDGSELVGRPEVAAIAARALLGRPGELLVTATVSLALLTSILGMTMAGPRVVARMADDGALPRALGTVAGQPPRAAIVAQAAIALLFLWATGLQQLMTYIGWTLSLCAAAAVVGLVRVRLREGGEAVACRGWPWVPIVFVGAVLWFAIGAVVAAPRDSLLALGTVVAAASLAHLLGRRRADRA
ncbi:MAG: APC family permease [Planctomycetes bacterium]|nr:APC family permease [Planctomycetota bacterium]